MTKTTINKISNSEQQTRDFAAQLAKHLPSGAIVCLFGDLGAGKTTFVKGLARGMTIKPQEVTSPSYVLMHIYEGRPMSLFHFDLYRLEDLIEIEMIGYDEFLYGNDVSVIEWAERLQDAMPAEYLAVTICHRRENQRSLKVKAVGKPYQDIIEKFNHAHIID